MSSRPRLSATVLISTYNRAELLRQTLESLRAVRSTRRWDVLVVDNNSSDGTREAVERMADGFPVPLRYLFERRAGKSHALNSGLAQANGDAILFTDDDVRVRPNWVDVACDALENDKVAYCGGPVRPIWGGTPPAWLDRMHGDLWGTLAILDYGPSAFTFEERRKIPIGANMAVHQRLIDQIGGFNPALGRIGNSLLGQEQAEFFSRSRAAGAVGRYVPAMEVEHHVPPQRLRRQYFRRWWFWKGVARARMDSLHPVTELGMDLRRVPHVAGVPRYLFGALPRHLAGWLAAAVRGRPADAAREEMRFWFTIGYIRARWARSSSPLSARPGASWAKQRPTISRAGRNTGHDQPASADGGRRLIDAIPLTAPTASASFPGALPRRTS